MASFREGNGGERRAFGTLFLTELGGNVAAVAQWKKTKKQKKRGLGEIPRDFLSDGHNDCILAIT